MNPLGWPATVGRARGRVVRELAWVVVLKLALLVLLWWAFVRGAHVPVDAQAMAARAQAAMTTPTTEMTKENSNGH